MRTQGQLSLCDMPMWMSRCQDLAGLLVKFYKARAIGVRKAGEHRNTVMGHQP